MLRAYLLPAALATAALAAACNPYDPDLGRTPFKCGSDDPVCPEGYECVMDVCTRSDGADQVDATSSQFSCSDDGSVEGRPGNNDEIARAFVTPIPTMQSYTLVGLAICPTGDKDTFKFSVNQTGLNFEASITSIAGRQPLALRVLNNAGVEITTGTATGGQVVRAELSNRLAVGDYYVQVLSQDGTENNYDLTIKVCSTPLPCP